MQQLLKQLAKILPTDIAYAHCDYPCGIYDPHHAIIGALTVIRMMDIIKDTADHIKEGGADELMHRNNFVRAVKIKDEHAEIVKREVAVIWGDYFKKEQIEKYPELNDLVHEIMKLASNSKQGIERSNAVSLLDKVNRFAEVFWQTKGKETKRVKAPYKPEEEIVFPIL